MKCTTCGAEVMEGTMFCTSCGSKITPAASPAPSSFDNPAPAPTPTSYSNPAPAPAPVNNYQQYNAPVMNTPQAQPVSYGGYSQPQYQPQPYNGGMMQDTTPISPIGYIGYMLLYSLPIIGIIMVFVNALGSSTNINVKNFAKAYLILFIVGFIVGILTTIFFGAVFGSLANELSKLS